MIFMVILALMLFLDIYTFKGIRILLANNSHSGLKKIIFISYWTVTAFMIVLILTGYFFRSSTRNPAVFNWYFYLFGAFLVLYVPKILFVAFHSTEDILYGFAWMWKKIFVTKAIVADGGTTITRSKFLSQIGLILASLPFMAFIWGMVKGRFNFRVEHVKLTFPNLPKSFDGLKIAQVSDIHIGSFNGFTTQVEEAIDMLNAQDADILFFTGDLVNNFSEELEGWIPILSRMKSKYGKYSILGNHDYGDYYKNWSSKEEKAENFKKIEEAHAEMGFQLLNNQSVKLSRNGDEIAVIGCENWGHPPFPQYADFKKASEGTESMPFKILLTHNPDHWDDKIQGQTDVDLTFSGHTHGMQFGIRIAGTELWSPAQYKYKHWAGLYKEGNQFLYVNRGLGYIGYPGRVGMPPEITVIELKCS
ncbi:MAG TPA: metallophosphoesterase [Bacteroidales bacterium]